MNDNNQWLLKYAGLTMQFLAGIGLCVFIGNKVDSYFGWNTPLTIWLLPLLFIAAVITKIVIETGKKK